MAWAPPWVLERGVKNIGFSNVSASFALILSLFLRLDLGIGETFNEHAYIYTGDVYYFDLARPAIQCSLSQSAGKKGENKKARREGITKTIRRHRRRPPR